MYELLGAVLQWGPHGGPHAPMGPGHGPHWGGGAGTMPWSGAGVGFGYGLVWPLLGLLLLAVVVVGAVYLFGAEAAGADTESDRATELLRERYARGDLTDEEFERRAARLAGDAGESSTAR